MGAYLPDYILDNIELSHMVDTSDEWIMSRIGIKTRHILKGEGLGTSYMARARREGPARKDGIQIRWTSTIVDLRDGNARHVLPVDGQPDRP